MHLERQLTGWRNNQRKWLSRLAESFRVAKQRLS
jgi:hypothetical protein